MQKTWAKRPGFTIVELLVVIVILGILTGLTVAVYAGVQKRSRLAKIETDIKAVQKLIESHKARTGTYPITAAVLNPDWGTTTATTDNDCTVGTSTPDWIPGLSAALPQSAPTKDGVGGYPGCYTYSSNGTVYILSAWNMLPEPQTTTLYRRVGLREMDPSHIYAMFYICNHSGIGGVIGGVYNANEDYYKHSYTVSNMKAADCVETPPAGA